jgi:RimJ/RimL family protein N-acetyltransferase
VGQLGSARTCHRHGGRDSAGHTACWRFRYRASRGRLGGSPAAQGHGYAKEAARSLVALLHGAGWTVIAHIHPGHLASQRVARGAGLSPTTDVRDGEIRWVSGPPAAP